MYIFRFVALLLGTPCAGGGCGFPTRRGCWSIGHTFASEGGGRSTQQATDSETNKKMSQHRFEIDFRPGGSKHTPVEIPSSGPKTRQHDKIFPSRRGPPKKPDTAGQPSWINLSRTFIENVFQKQKKKG